MKQSRIATMRQKSSAFITQLQHRNHTMLVPFDEERWFRGAYATFARTLRDDYKPLTDEQKKDCREKTFNGLLALRTKSFDKGFEQLCKSLSKSFSLSIGHSQKLLAILLKYGFCVTHANPETLAKVWIKLISDNSRTLPVPIDAIVLHSLKSGWPDTFQDIRSSQSWNKKTNKYNSPAAAVLQKAKWVPWSGINDWKTYSSLQSRIRKLASTFKMNPLEFEMENLWAVSQHGRKGTVVKDGLQKPPDEPLKRATDFRGSEPKHSKECRAIWLNQLHCRTGEPHEHALRIVNEESPSRNLGAICRRHFCLDLKMKGYADRYLIEEITIAGGHFVAERPLCRVPGCCPNGPRRVGVTCCWGGTHYEAGVHFDSMESAVRYLKKYFHVRACPGNQTYGQIWIDAL